MWTLLGLLSICLLSAVPGERIPGEISNEKCEYYYKKFGRKANPVLSVVHDATLPDKSCKNGQPLISNGEDAKEAEFPHMVRLGYNNAHAKNSLQWLCGGSLISEQFVLTAAHCILVEDYLKPGPTFVQIGAKFFNDTVAGNRHLQEIEVEESIPHPSYKKGSFHNDIGLVKLKEPPKFPRITAGGLIRLKPACLFTGTDYLNLGLVLVSGWGNIKDLALDTKIATKLQKATLKVANTTSCVDNFSTAIQLAQTEGQGWLKDSIDETIQFCAGTADGKDSCKGDSGGPLQRIKPDENTKCMYEVLGVVSGGKLCSEKKIFRLGIYTKVSSYIKWIEDQVWPE